MMAFGQLLRKYRHQRLDPLRGNMLTQERLGELLGHELGDARYSGAAVSDWERGKSKIAVDDRFALVSLITVLHKQGGIALAIFKLNMQETHTFILLGLRPVSLCEENRDNFT